MSRTHTIARAHVPIALLALLAATSIRSSGTAERVPVPWLMPVYLGQGEPWRQRVPLTIRNPGPNALDGAHVPLTVGDAPGQLPLAGRPIDEIRVLDARGRDMLYAILSPDGQPREEGPLAKGDTLVFPVELAPGASTRSYVYFENTLAWPVPDFLEGVALPDLDGGFERGAGDLPAGWFAKEIDPQHRVTWNRDQGRDNSRCVRVEVDPGARPSWVGLARRRANVAPGARYHLRGWVKTRDVNGRAGWFVHVGNAGSQQLLNRTTPTLSGSADWQALAMEFTAPPNADSLVVGTLLHGTGTAWFDDLAIESDAPDTIPVTVDPPEHLQLAEIGRDTPWPDDPSATKRVPLSVSNPGDRPLGPLLATVDLGAARASAWNWSPADLRVDGRKIPFLQLGDTLLFECSVPPRSRAVAHLALAPPDTAKTGERHLAALVPASEIPSDTAILPSADPDATRPYAALLRRPINLVQNADFTSGTPLPERWIGPAPGPLAPPALFSLETPGLFGARCAKLSVPHDAKPGWRGWKQRVPIRPGGFYHYAAWGKCRDLRGRALLHAHLLDARGRLIGEHGFLSAGLPISGDTDWTLWQGSVTAPDDAAFLELHLTMDCTGTLLHDGALVIEGAPALSGPIQTRPDNARTHSRTPDLWTINAIRKVFPDDLPPASGTPATRATLSLARGEREPIQIALRSPRAIPSLKIEVADPPRGPGGATLPHPEIAIVGLVPIDAASNYYHSDTPAWHRKFPTSKPGSDGWPGLWPDPLLPRHELDLEAGRTRAAWITFHAPADAVPGEYKAKALVSAPGIASIPLDLTLQVRAFALPEHSRFAAIYDLRTGPQWQRDGLDPTEIRHELMRFLKERRVCPDSVGVNPTFVRGADGKITADFSEYDAEAAFYFDRMRFPVSYTPGFFYLFGWGHPPKKILGEAPYDGAPPYETADRTRLRPAYKSVYQRCLKLFWDHARARGWADRLLLYISDEPHFTHAHIRDQMRALCDMIHEVDPKIPIYSSTWRHCPDWDHSLDVWGVGHYGCFPAATMRQLRDAGSRIWFTTDGQMCTDTPFCAVERLLPHYCFHHGADAYEFWGVTWLTYDPHRRGWHRYIHQSSEPGKSYHVRYPNGDGYLAYPGAPIGHPGPVSSIRLEQAREGVEDLEYLDLLRSRAESAPESHPAKRRARDLLARAAALVPIPNAGGRHSTSILPDPDAPLALRDEIADAIEALAPPR